MNQSKRKKTLSVTGTVPVFFAFLIGISLFLALRSDFDGGIGHFASDSLFFAIFAGGCVLSLLFSAGAAFLWKKKQLDFPEPLFGGLAGAISPCGAALSALILFFMNLRELITERAFTWFSVGETLLLPGIALFFILSVIPSRRGGRLHGAMGILACLSVNCMLFKSYFDFTLPLNSPIRNALAVTEAAVLLSVLVTTGSILGKNAPPVCCFVRASAVSLAGGISLGLLLAALFVPQSIPDGVSVLLCALCFFAAAALLSQTFSYSHTNDKQTSEAVSPKEQGDG